MPVIDPDAPQPPYLQIAADLRAKIRAGALQAGERLRSSRELMGDYGVASMTVHQAIKVLRDEGTVVSHPGRGVYVAEVPAEEPPAERPEAADVREEIAQIRAQLELVAKVDNASDLEAEVQDLRAQVGRLEAHLIDLYAKVGQAYPHERASQQRPSDRRRRASSD